MEALASLYDRLSDCPPFAYVSWLERAAHAPAFVYHEPERETFEAHLRYLQANAYRTVHADELLAGRGRMVALCFDDGYRNVFDVAFPLLQRYGMKAIVFAVPGFIDGHSSAHPERYATWQQLREMAASGLVDVQSHSNEHRVCFCGQRVLDFQRPTSSGRLLYYDSAWSDEPDYDEADILGAPVYEGCWRGAAVRRYYDDPELRRACTRYVQDRGGAEFFNKPDWRGELVAQVAQHRRTRRAQHQWRRVVDRERYIVQSLAESKRSIEQHLGQSCRHFALPKYRYDALVAKLARQVGYESLFVGTEWTPRRGRRLAGIRVVPRAQSYWIPSLPGKGRTSLVSRIARKLT